MRVVSLVPSWTEFLHDVGVEVVGQTKFCVHPSTAHRTVPRVGGTKNVRVDAVLDLAPDIVVCNREENDRAQIEALQAALPGRAHVEVTDVRTVHDAWVAMRHLGRITGNVSKASSWVQRIQDAWGDPRPQLGEAGYVVWQSPWMVAGPDTYIHDVMAWWGIANACASTATHATDRYPTLAEDLDHGASCCDAWLLPSEPFPFSEKHVQRLNDHSVASKLVDGEAFSWYGSRMAKCTAHLNEVADWVAHQGSTRGL